MRADYAGYPIGSRFSQKPGAVLIWRCWFHNEAPSGVEVPHGRVNPFETRVISRNAFGIARRTTCEFISVWFLLEICAKHRLLFEALVSGRKLLPAACPPGKTLRWIVNRFPRI